MKNVKIVVFAPSENADSIRRALGDAGAGSLGYYTHSSYSVMVDSRFTPQAGADPHIGEVGQPQLVKEERIEVICEREKARSVIEIMKQAHPYEEVAFDILPLLDEEEL